MIILLEYIQFHFGFVFSAGNPRQCETLCELQCKAWCRRFAQGHERNWWVKQIRPL